MCYKFNYHILLDVIRGTSCVRKINITIHDAASLFVHVNLAMQSWRCMHVYWRYRIIIYVSRGTSAYSIPISTTAQCTRALIATFTENSKRWWHTYKITIIIFYMYQGFHIFTTFMCSIYICSHLHHTYTYIYVYI